jgi:hypothetical protein
MARRAGSGTGSTTRRRDRLPGLYSELLHVARQQYAKVAADAGAPVVLGGAYADNLTAAEKRDIAGSNRRRELAALKRRIDALEAGRPQLLPVHQIRRRPDAERIAWLQDDHWAADRAAAPYLVRVDADDSIRVGQTVAQFDRQKRLIGGNEPHAYPHGYVDVETGEWTPTKVKDLETGEWRDRTPDDVIPGPEVGSVR